MRPRPLGAHVLLAAALVAGSLATTASGEGTPEPPDADRPMFAAMRAELARATSELALPNEAKPYYVAYWVADESDRTVEATLGTLVSNTTERDRFVKVEVRVGSRASDNSNLGDATADGDFVRESELLSPEPTTLDPDEGAIRRDLWLATDAAYKGAIQSLERRRAGKQSEVAQRNEVPSFSNDVSARVIVKDEKSQELSDPVGVARHVSTVFRSFPELQKSGVRVLETSMRRRFLASDGGLVVEPSRFAGIEIEASTQATDGMPLDRTAFLPASGGAWPEVAAVAQARKIGAELAELRTAEVADDYSGPVLFEGKAAAELVFDLLGESLSGTPPVASNTELEGPLSRKLGKRILPADFSVVDDPTISTWAGLPLMGHYAIDDEGIAAARTVLVEGGRLKNFLMSRTPREGIDHSNGHGRSGLIGWARGHVGNLIVSSKHGLSESALRARFLSAVRDEGLTSGLIVRELTPRTSASNGDMVPDPEIAYRVTLDGRETLVRGGQIAPLSVRDLREVLAAGREPNAYDFLIENDDGIDLPTSVIAPALLLEDVEVRSPTNPNKRPPVVPRPPLDPKPPGFATTTK